MKIFAHRGMSAHFPENSQTAIKQCAPEFMTGIEIDLFQAGDNFIVIHDRWLTRLFGLNIQTTDLTQDELNSIKGADGNPIPTLQWLISTVAEKALTLNIELKKITNVDLFFSQLKQVCDEVNFQMENLLISSFNHVYLKKLHTLDSSLKLGLLLTNRPVNIKKYLIDFPIFSIHLDMDCMSESFIKEVKSLGTEVYIFTVDQPAEIKWCYQHNVDGIFANDPQHAFNMVKGLS